MAWSDGPPDRRMDCPPAHRRDRHGRMDILSG
jgi:hypothetical protein